MQNYGQQPGYQRPGSAASFAGQPPSYGGYHSTAPQPQSQWAPPAQNQASNQQWNQAHQQQGAGGYNPGKYGAMPEGQQVPSVYPPQHDQPPPPPPKPYGFAAAVQQQQAQTQGWAQQPQQYSGIATQQQGGYPVQGGGQSQQQAYSSAGPQPPTANLGGYQVQGGGQNQQSAYNNGAPLPLSATPGGYPVQGGVQNQQPAYNNVAPPPPSATPGGSYFPPAQGGRPGSIYGANQASSFSNSQPPGPPPQTVMSPNEQQPAYIPPSLTGQGVQAYMPSNTNPMPGVYVPPPPDVPAWQQAQHAPLQGGQKKFKYTKPTVDSNLYAQGYQGVQPQQPPPNQYGHVAMGPPHPLQSAGPPPSMDQYAPQQPLPQVVPQQPTQDSFAQHGQPQQQPYGQPMQQPGQQPIHQGLYAHSQQAQQQEQYPQSQSQPPPQIQGVSNISKPYNQWENTAPVNQEATNISKPYNQWAVTAPVGQGQSFEDYQRSMQASSGAPQPQWQPGHSQPQDPQASHGGQPYPQPPAQDIQAPKPLTRTDTASSNFFDQPSPQSQPVSPVNHRNSLSFSSTHQAGLGRAGSVSSIALANLHAQREGSKTSSPKPPPPKLPTPPPPRDDASKFSALASGRPSDWEHFGGDVEIDDEEMFAKKDEPAMFDSVELPGCQPELSAHPSPPSTHGWPSPATQPVISSERKDTYQPTPPPVIASLAEQPSQPQQNFIVGDAAPAPLSISPKPMQGSRPPSTQQTFQIGDGAWHPPKQGTPVQRQTHYQPPTIEEGFVMDDGGWAAQSVPTQAREQTPTQQHRQPPPVTTGFVVDDGVRGISQKTPTQESSSWGPQRDEQHTAELRAKDEELEHLRKSFEKEKADLRAVMDKERAELHAEIERERSDLHAEVEKLKAGVAHVAKNTADDKIALQGQMAALSAAAVLAKSSTDAVVKEKDMTIERMKEDAEGKEHNIEERDAIIVDLRHQLEEEQSKEETKTIPTPADLIPDLDPWYVGSLERYITMLRGEANEPHVEDKIKTFRAFLKAESGIRRIEFYDAPPQVPVADTTVHVPLTSDGQVDKALELRPEPTAQVSGHYMGSNLSKTRNTNKELSVHVPIRPRQESPDEEDYDYSPGGRPVLKRKATIPTTENVTNFPKFGASSRSSTILTPTSSVDDDSNRTPVQSPPEELSQPLYKAYVPPALFTADATPSPHRQSLSDVCVPAPVISQSAKLFEHRQSISTSKHHDEIFFGANEETPKRESRPTSSDSATPDVAVLAPLAFASHHSVSTELPLKKDPVEALADLLPTQVTSARPHHSIEELKTKLAQFKTDTSNIDNLTKQWNTTATAIRKKKDAARRQRQEENEEINEDAFSNEEISYARLKALEAELKLKEGEVKAQEDRDEYKSYVEAVFDPVYDTLQSDIKSLMDLYIDAESLMHTSVSGIESLSPDTTAPSTLATLTFLQDIHAAILARHASVVTAVADRDKRYKKTETQPLYAAGNIPKMRTVEQHFDAAEKQATVRALRDKAGRAGELVGLVENVLVSAVGTEQRDIEAIMSALRACDDGTCDAALLTRVQDALRHLKASSKALLALFNTVGIAHNTAVLDAEIAQAKVEGKDVETLEAEKKKGEEKFNEEFERRVGVLDSDEEELQEMMKRKEKVGSEEVERKERLKMALEEAKRRNGDV